VVPIRLPPLRERTEDVPELLKHFLTLCASEGLPVKSLDAAAIDRLKRHRWPGNVRELENLVRRLAALYTQETIGVDVIEQELSDSAAPSAGPGPAPARGDDSLATAVERHLKVYFDAHQSGLPAAGLHDRVLREIEKPLILLTLAATRGTQIKAAQVLGINRNTLRKKIRDLDIQVTFVICQPRAYHPSGAFRTWTAPASALRALINLEIFDISSLKFHVVSAVEALCLLVRQLEESDNKV
jgi:two-component system nitrogen regulation response regulator GlnG